MKLCAFRNRCLLAAGLLGLGLAPAGLWATPTVYIAGGDADHVLVVDGIDNQVTADGRYGVATHATTGGISVIDMRAGELMHHIAAGTIPNYAVANAPYDSTIPAASRWVNDVKH